MDYAEKKDFQEVIAYLDRIEKLENNKELAVFLVEVEEEFQEFTLPKYFLPKESSDGEYFTIKISKNLKKTEEARNETLKILKRMEE